MKSESVARELGALGRESSVGGESHEGGHRGHEHGHRGHEDGVCSGAVLDIGGDTGALVIYSDEHMVGGEIEICPSGEVALREHNVVRARRTPTGLVYAAVFPALLDGEYSVLTKDLLPSHHVSVIGGRVTEIDCRSSRLKRGPEDRRPGA